MDGFHNVFGKERGKLQGDTVLSNRPTEAGREDLERYRSQMRERKFDETIHLLSQNRSLIATRPLLQQLTVSLCQFFIDSSALQFDDAIRHYLSEMRVYTRESDYLVVSKDLSNEPRKQPGANRKTKPDKRVLHIWPEGDMVGPLNCMNEPGQTVCGYAIDRMAWQRVFRGAWHSDNLDNVGWKLCEQCDKECPENLAYIKEESTHYIPFGATLYHKLIRHLSKPMLKELLKNDFRNAEQVGQIADQTYRRLMLPASVEYAIGGKEKTVQWLLEGRQWRSLVREHGGPVHELLTKEDWSKALGSCIPRTDAHGNVQQASPAQFATARDYLVKQLQARATATVPGHNASAS
jgi:hypothetical protein